MTEIDFICWRCGVAFDEPLPLARAAACIACRADLHVCKLCEFYALGVANECREPIAERVVNKERANFCGYFKLKPGAHQASVEADTSRAALADLFGDATVKIPTTPSSADAAKVALDDLFRKPD